MSKESIAIIKSLNAQRVQAEQEQEAAKLAREEARLQARHDLWLPTLRELNGLKEEFPTITVKGLEDKSYAPGFTFPSILVDGNFRLEGKLGEVYATNGRKLMKAETPTELLPKILECIGHNIHI